MRVLVTGSAGFIGSHVAEGFAAAGHAVVGVDDLSAGRRRELAGLAGFVQMDIGSADLRHVLGDHRPEVVCHLAAQCDVRASVADPARDATINIVGSLNLLESCAPAGVRGVVFASSGGVVYGEQDAFPADEDHPRRPACPYGVAKLAVEEYLGYYGRACRLASVSLRLANVFGPHQRPDGEMGVVAIFLGQLLRGEPLTINGDGGQTRDFVFVDDVVSLHLRAAEALAAGRLGDPPLALNVGTGRETSIREIADRLCALAGGAARITHSRAKPGEQRRSVLDATRAATLLGWRAARGLEEGLARTLQWMREGMGVRGLPYAASPHAPPPGDPPAV